ncbi:hypothetical protein BZA05DRAFT_368727 [Tricharina praecox]|uniref:uncharacterized protein n=1 Tax=Tricharina praecox TaxID=43433 RepID=UPI00221E75A2|nr:uncharacterized protein BZA05DRAFT_368727 [Tricharina praecox]KAI5856275.1 hypothetical protein BZA05DRAFT_368727 [Tricharina praecox]
MSDPTTTTAIATLHTLSTRLSRLEFTLTGSPRPPAPSPPATTPAAAAAPSAPAPPAPPTSSTSADPPTATPIQIPIRTRIATLQSDLQRLQVKSRTVAEILQIHANYPEAFTSTPHRVAEHGPPASSKAATVLSSAPDLASTASRLSAIGDTPIPASAASARLVALLPRLQELEETQRRQARKVAELRSRSVRVLEQWYQVGVVGVNECFAEWDERTGRVERGVVRRGAEGV